ncbi:MAG: YfhO family protein [Chloroflexi bacterium]|nr:YfhO family protein [Chloroflexota bacterium]
MTLFRFVRSELLFTPRFLLAYARMVGRFVGRGPFLPAALFLACALVLFGNAIVDRRIYAEADTLTYYVPLARRIDDALARGRFPLWTPDIFGGHPLFAESEGAMLYPLNLAAWILLPVDSAVIVLRVLRFFLASLFMYAFGRAVGLSRSAATVAGLVFAFGSFLVGQIHHKNLVDAAIWLPLVLCLVERGLQSAGARRWRFLLLGGLAFATQLLTIHVNPILMTFLLLVAYVAARMTFLRGERGTPTIAPPLPLEEAPTVCQDGSWGEGVTMGGCRTSVDRRRVGASQALCRLLSGLAATMVVVIVGIGVAAVQLLPLYELSTFSFRGRPVTHEFATSFALPPPNLLTLLFPYFFRDPIRPWTLPDSTNPAIALFPDFFRDPAGAYWSPWFRWDTTFYAGIAPLLLAIVAIGLTLAQAVRAPREPRHSSETPRLPERPSELSGPVVPSRWVVFFSGVLAASVLLSLGDHSPVKVYALVWQLPVFSSTRMPSRYTFLALFALAVLAGLGLHGLERLLSRSAPVSGRGAATSPPVPLPVLGALARGKGEAFDGRPRPVLSRLRWILLVPTALGLATVAAFWLLREWTMADPQAARALLAPYLALRGQTLLSGRPQDPLASLSASLDPLSPWTQRSFACLGLALLLLWAWYLLRRPGLLFRTGLVLVTAVDLLFFARDFHPRVPLESIISDGPAARFLVERVDRLHRVGTLWPVWETGPNRLLPWRIAEANGYSSLLPDRHGAYMDKANQLDNRLLDVMGVRYLIVHRQHVPWRLQSSQPIFQDPEVAIFDRPSALPRALVVSRATFAPGPAEALRSLARYDFDPLREIVVEDQAALSWTQGTQPAEQSSPADVLDYSSERIVARVRLGRPSFLFLADTYYPGWRAFVDGEERPVYRANYLFRAVPVPPGEHTVEFIFDPLSVRVGAALSTLSLVTLALGLAATFRRGAHTGSTRGNPLD